MSTFFQLHVLGFQNTLVELCFALFYQMTLLLCTKMHTHMIKTLKGYLHTCAVEEVTKTKCCIFLYACLLFSCQMLVTQPSWYGQSTDAAQWSWESVQFVPTLFQMLWWGTLKYSPCWRIEAHCKLGPNYYQSQPVSFVFLLCKTTSSWIQWANGKLMEWNGCWLSVLWRAMEAYPCPWLAKLEHITLVCFD